MLTKEDLKAIKCTQCGNCCRNSCSHKERLPDGRSECKVHPLKLFGSNTKEDQMKAIDYGRGRFCHTTPLELFAEGYYCPPVTEALCENSGLPLPEEEPRGRLIIKNWGPDGRWVFDVDYTGVISIKDWENENPIHPLRRFFEELP